MERHGSRCFKLVELYLVRSGVIVDANDGTCSERGVLHALAFGEARLAYEPRYASVREVVGGACFGEAFGLLEKSMALGSMSSRKREGKRGMPSWSRPSASLR